MVDINQEKCSSLVNTNSLLLVIRVLECKGLIGWLVFDIWIHNLLAIQATCILCWCIWSSWCWIINTCLIFAYGQSLFCQSSVFHEIWLCYLVMWYLIMRRCVTELGSLSYIKWCGRTEVMAIPQSGQTLNYGSCNIVVPESMKLTSTMGNVLCWSHLEGKLLLKRERMSWPKSGHCNSYPCAWWACNP